MKTMRWILISGAFLAWAMLVTAPAQGQQLPPGYGTAAGAAAAAQAEHSRFLVRCEDQWSRNMPMVGGAFAEAECEMEYAVFEEDSDCDAECMYEEVFGNATGDNYGNEYEGSEGGTCLTCAGWKPN